MNPNHGMHLSNAWIGAKNRMLTMEAEAQGIQLMVAFNCDRDIRYNVGLRVSNFSR